MPEINKPINKVVAAIIDYVDPELNRKIFMAKGVGTKPGTGQEVSFEATLDDSKSLNLPEYRIKYIYCSADEDPKGVERAVKIANLITNYKDSNITSVSKQMILEEHPQVAEGYEKLERVVKGL